MRTLFDFLLYAPSPLPSTSDQTHMVYVVSYACVPVCVWMRIEGRTRKKRNPTENHTRLNSGKQKANRSVENPSERNREKACWGTDAKIQCGAATVVAATTTAAAMAAVVMATAAASAATVTKNMVFSSSLVCV